MFAWEREALGIDTLGEIQGSVSTRMRLEIAGSNRSAWWIAMLFGPDFWTHWRVGLLRPTYLGACDTPIAPPDPLLLGWPKHLERRPLIEESLDFIAVCPAILNEKALAFGVIGAMAEEVSAGTVEPAHRWTLVSPTDLRERLGLVAGTEVRIRLLPATYRADPPHRR